MNLVTGATGFLGSHIVERLLETGQSVRVIVRPGSNTTFLDGLPLDRVVGDLTDPSAADRACKGIDTIYHAAAKVDVWGPWSEFRKHTVEATQNLANSARKASVRRFLHVSRAAVCGGSPAHEQPILDDDRSLRRHLPRWNQYGLAKALAERILWRLHRADGFPVTVIRPTCIYGPRDRVTVPAMFRWVKRRRLRILGDGENRLGVVFVRDVAEACVLAAGNNRAVGQAYNCTSDEPVTQRQFLSLWAEAFGCPAATRTVPYSLAFGAASICEWAARLLRRKTAPPLTRYGIWAMGRRPCPSIDKARQQLGWTPRTPHRDGVALSARWFLENAHE